ncbi:unnamed protein product [marine sediment metagenome]|uniref:Uncharacterized protein n=1 Tax=marine sediment metagenome TaxID=412755 RepID=X1D716_9ZZZZ
MPKETTTQAKKLKGEKEKKEVDLAPSPKPIQVLEPVTGDSETETKETPRIKTVLDVVGFARGRAVGRKEGFADGRRYTVTIAEDYLAQSLKLPSRDALANSNQIPTWWIAALFKAWGVEALPDDILTRTDDLQ